MGLFSTKKKISVNTTVTRLIENKSIQSSVPGSVTASIMQNDGQLVENVLEGLVAGIGVRAQRMYAYGKKSYTYGVPSSTITTRIRGSAEVDAAVKAAVGATAIVDYYRFGPQNILHTTWKTLVDTYGYKSSTNTLDVLSASIGSTVYLVDMQVVLMSATFDSMGMDVLEEWDNAASAGPTANRVATPTSLRVATPFRIDATATTNHVLVTYNWRDTVGLKSATLSLPITYLDSADTDADYFQVRYLLGGNAGYWSYKEGSAGIPSLDAVFATNVIPFGSFFPITYFRYNKAPVSTDVNSAVYKTSSKLVNYIGVNYANLVNEINANPDIKDVEQAMLIMAASANTVDPIEQRYLFDFFSRVVDQKVAAETAPIPLLSSRAGLLGIVSKLFTTVAADNAGLVVQDSRFKMVLGMSSVYRKKKAGRFMKVGQYSGGFGSVGIPVTTESVGLDGLKSVVISTYNIPTHYYRHQITDSVYEEIEVTGLRTTYHIWNGYNTVGEETSPLLLVPMDYSITSKYPITERELLYSRSLQLVFNSVTVTKIKWYQTGIFKAILLIIAIVVMIFTYGATWQATVAVLATMTATALAYAVIIAILKYLIISYLVKLFIKAVGTKIAFIVAILAVVAAAYGYLDAGSITGVPWANTLLTVASNLTTGIGNALEAGIAALHKESIAFGLLMEGQNKLLETANELLDGTGILSPMIFFGETPDDFYNRTVHSGNIGVVGIGTVSSYVDVALTLPKLIDTMR